MKNVFKTIGKINVLAEGIARWLGLGGRAL
jgi:hypothetical protein